MTFSLIISTVFYIAIFCHQWCSNVYAANEARPRVAQFASLEVYEGQSIELPCTISAISGLTVCWHVASDQAVANGSRYIAFCEDPDRLSEHDDRHAIMIDKKSGTYNLKINRVLKSDSGIYMCAIINEEGIAVLFGSGRLSVTKPTAPSIPPTCTFLARDILKEGEMVSATCFAATDGIPLPTLQWMDGDNEMPMSQDTVAQANQINWEVSAKDAGAIYKCLEHHIALESPRNCTIGPLNVLYRPKLHLKARPSKPKMGHNVTLTCTADCNPELTGKIHWYIEGVSIHKMSDLNYRLIDDVQNISQLILYNMKEEIFNSSIICSAENNQGQKNVTIVFPPPPKKSKRVHATLRMVLILDLVALSMIVFFSVCVLGCWNSWRTLSWKIRTKCIRRSIAEPHHVPL